MKFPTNELGTAIEWLRNNEGDGEESRRCRVVADWLEHQERERLIRNSARQAGVSVARFRDRLTEIEQQKGEA